MKRVLSSTHKVRFQNGLNKALEFQCVFSAGFMNIRHFDNNLLKSEYVDR